MSKVACIFPGQGSQEVGMGKAFYDNFAAAKEVYQEVDDALGQHLSTLIFSGDPVELTRTENAQPAIMATSMAVLRVMEREAGFDIATKAQYGAGHSLGEYSALCALGALSLRDTATLLAIRGRAMQDAAPQGTGMMAAILGLELAQVEQLCADSSSGICEVANDNAPGQIVVSGDATAVEAIIIAAKDVGAKRALALQVSAPFHSSLIASAADVMAKALDAVSMHDPSLPLVANICADAVQDADVIRDLLVQQVTGRVRWTESVQWMVNNGVSSTIEIGHGKVLSGLNRRIDKTITSHNIASPDDIEAFVNAA